jgi:hypothetical protein
MALPYPHEVETGQLNPRGREVRHPFDIADHLARAIAARGDALVMFGVSLPAASSEAPEDTASRFRAALVSHFNERRPNADAATWDLFASQAEAQLQQLEQADEHALRALLMTVDGL